MATTTKKYRRETKTIKGLLFNPDMYNNIFGSLIITHYILSEIKPSVEFINKRWQQLIEDGTDLWLGTPEFFEKLLDMFELAPKYGQFAMVQSRFNCLFAPYINEQILPIREDGFLGNTLMTGKIYPIVKGDN